MDWSTVVVLAAVTWLDGVRRVPAGALILHRVLGGQWSVADREAGPGLRLVSWWNPFTVALIVPGGGVADVDGVGEPTDDALAARLARIHRVVGVLRLLGGLVVVAIVFGVPAAIARFDAWGLAAALAAVMLLCVMIAIIVACAMRSAGRAWRRAARIAAPLLYPFTAPRAAELVLGHAIAGAAPLIVARRLLGAAPFAVWVRPQAYDVMHRGGMSSDPRGLVALIGQSGITQIVRTPPAHCAASERYCARCARVYRATAMTCPECQGLPLVSHPTG